MINRSAHFLLLTPRSVCEQMTDSKASAVCFPVPESKPPAPEKTLIAEALSGVLLPEVTRIVWEYARRPAHRFEERPPPGMRATVSADGRSVATIASPSGQEVGHSDGAVHAVWSRYTLRDGAQRWSFHLPAHRACWVGVADVRSRPVASSADAGAVAPYFLEAVTLGNWLGSSGRIFSCSSMQSVQEGVHSLLMARGIAAATQTCRVARSRAVHIR
jgi:hypothetical protein